MARELRSERIDSAAGTDSGDVLSSRAAVAAVRAAVGSWEGVTTHDHRFGGIEFRVGRRELGHLHATIADLPFPAACATSLSRLVGRDRIMSFRSPAG
jgi:hypothetical protein